MVGVELRQSLNEHSANERIEARREDAFYVMHFSSFLDLRVPFPAPRVFFRVNACSQHPHQYSRKVVLADIVVHEQFASIESPWSHVTETD